MGLGYNKTYYIQGQMFIAEDDCSVEWLTSICNLIVAQGRIPDDWIKKVTYNEWALDIIRRITSKAKCL